MLVLFTVLAVSAHAQLYLNEMMSSNSVTIPDNYGVYSDWVELYNSGPGAVDTNGYYITDTPTNLTQWRFPSRIIPTGGYLLVWASNKDIANTSGPLHTNFAIKAGGEPIILTLPDGVTQADAFPSVALSNDQSYGRLPDGSANLVILPAPSPNGNNSVIPPPPAPLFSKSTGFYNSGFNLTISALPNTTIYYTLDGTTPTNASAVYAAPIPIVNNTGSPNVVSMVNTTSPYWAPPPGQVPKADIVRAIAMNGNLSSSVTSATYFLDGTHAMAVVSITTDSANLFDYYIGIYTMGASWDNATSWPPENPLTFHPANYQNEGDAWERPVHLEIFETNGTRVVNQDVGMRVTGQGSRVREQKSLKFYARANFGPSSISYPLFGPQGFTSYKRLWIRNSDDDERATYLRDVLAHTLVQNTSFGIAMEPYRPSAVFLNGEYWGFYAMRDRASQFFIASRYGVSDKDVIILNDNVVIDNGNPGDEQSFLDMYDFVRTHDLSDPANYSYVQTQMDTDNFARYYAVNTYVADTDWIDRNLVYWRLRMNGTNTSAPPGKDGRWRWIMHDDDWSFGYRPGNGANYNMFNFIQTKSWGSTLWLGLTKNEQFRDDYVTISADQLMTNFATDSVISTLDALAAGVAPEIPGEIARWTNIPDVAAWEQNLEQIRQFARDRPAYHRQHIVQFFGLGGTALLNVAGNDSAGIVMVNSLNVTTPYTGTYFQDIPVTVTATPLPGKFFLGWTGIASGTNPTIRVVLRDDAILGAIFADAPGAAPAGSSAWVSRKYPATNVNAVEQVNTTLALTVENPASVPLNHTWSVDGGTGTAGPSSFIFRGAPGSHTVNVTVTGPGVTITQGWNLAVNASTTSTCYYNLNSIPATCTGGTITQDQPGGCRAIACSGSGATLSLIACEKPNSANPTYFEMYKQSSTGSGLTVCLGTACINSYSGFATKTLPLCVATPTGRSISFSSTSPAGSALTLNIGNSQQFNYTLSNPAGLPVTSRWSLNSTPLPADNQTSYIFNATTVGAYTLSVNVSSNESSIARAWSIIVQNATNGTTNGTNITCATTVYTVPVSCVGGALVNDTNSSGCRLITCQGTSGSTIAKACNKPGDYTPTKYEVYLQASSPGVSACVGAACVNPAGFAQATLPLSCNVTNATQPISFANTTPSGANVTIAEPASQAFSYTLNNPSGLTTTTQWLLDGATQGATGTTYTFPGSYTTNGTYNMTVIVTSSNNTIQRSWLLTVTDTAPPNATQPISFASTTPSGASVTIAEPASQAFSYTLNNPSGLTTTTQWLLNSATQGATGTTYTFPGSYTTNGTYNVSVKVTSSVNIVQRDWSLIVQDTPLPNASVALTIAPWFPQGRSYVFLCMPSGFTPTTYDFFFGDGQKNIGRNVGDVYYTYSAAGNYTVSCTAKAGAQQASSTLQVTVV